MTDAEVNTANIEEGAIDTDTNVRQRSSKKVPGQMKLSMTSKMYDVDGDGKLDEAEQAMRDLDTSNQGYLSNDKVYGIVKEQMEIQKKFLNMKRLIIGLSCFTIVLAVSNLGTAWAAALLAKDTMEKDGNLYTKDGETMIGTKAMFDKYDIVPDETGRRLDDVSFSGMVMNKAAAGDLFNNAAPATRVKQTDNDHVWYVTADVESSSGDGVTYVFETNHDAQMSIICPDGEPSTTICEVTIGCPRNSPVADSECIGFEPYDGSADECSYSADVYWCASGVWTLQ